MKFFVVIFIAMLAVVSAAINGLSTYHISDTTTSGLSSGGYMAVQVHIAFSSVFNGSAIFAGVRFYVLIIVLLLFSIIILFLLGSLLLCSKQYHDS
jgi:hypothetical protein